MVPHAGKYPALRGRVTAARIWQGINSPGNRPNTPSAENNRDIGKKQQGDNNRGS